MPNWREKNYCKIIGATFLAEGGLLLYSIFKYGLMTVWEVQFTMWTFFLVAVVVIAESVLCKKNGDNQRTKKIERFKDKYYDRAIAGIYAIQWLVLLLGDFQYDIGQYLLVDIVTWGAASITILIVLDESELLSKKK